MLDPGNGKTKTARLWVHAIDDRPHGGPTMPAAWFAFTTDRRAMALPADLTCCVIEKAGVSAAEQDPRPSLELHQ